MPNIPPPPDIPPIHDTGQTNSDPGQIPPDPGPADSDAATLSPEMAAYNRRYERVQDHLDSAVDLERAQRTLTARQLRAIEAGRREALATEYAYPQHNNAKRATEETLQRPKGGPESDDAVPTKWTTATIADQSYSAMVATELTISHREAERLVHTAEPLVNTYPRTLQVLEDGRTSYRHAFLLVDNGWSVPTDKVAEYETILLPFTETMTPPQFAAKAKAVAAKFMVDPIEERHQEALTRRSFTVKPCDDGMANVTLYIDAVAANGIRNRMRAVTRIVFRKEDGRSRAQVEADVAAELFLTGTTAEVGTPTMDQLNLFRAPDPESNTSPSASRVVFKEVPDEQTGLTGTDESDGSAVLGGGTVGSGLGAGILAKVAIHIPALTLLEHGNEPAYLENYGPISMETALLLAGNAPGFTRILTHPDTGATLSVGTKMYPVPLAMRFWILFRDGTCRFPGCTRPGKFCDLDHILDWAKGGETKVTNLVTLCKRHHMIKHNSGWSYLLEKANSIVTWTSPSNRQTSDDPAHHIPVREEGDTVVPDVGAPKGATQPTRENTPETIWDAATVWDAPVDPTASTDDLPF